MNLCRRAGVLTLALALAAPLAVAETRRYELSESDSELGVHVGRAGLFKVFGHDHWIVARGIGGHVEWDDEDPARSQFVLVIDASSLEVSDESLSDDDRREVQSNMEERALGLPAARTIRFESTEVQVDDAAGGTFRLRVRGELALRGAASTVEVPLELRLGDARLVASGTVEIDGRDWGVPQIAAAGGAVKTRNQLRIEFELVALSGPAP